ncbi:MAG: BBP7 family outer membrane beta-barrel protein, partial [Rubripirellula sp.]
MKTNLKKLALTAMLLSGSSMAMADNGTSTIGDLPGYGEDAYFGEEAAYSDTTEIYDSEDAAYQDETYDDGFVAPVAHSERSVIARAPRRRSVQTPAHATAYAPVQASQMQAASFSGDCGCESGNCGGGCGVEMQYNMGASCGCESASCDGGCGIGGGCGTASRMTNLFNTCDSNAWASLEALLWFAQPRDLAPLVLGSDPGTLPVLGQPGNVRTLFGGEGETDMSAGFRVDGGFWLSDHVGVGGRFWMLDESGSDFSFSGDGSDQSVGRSYFNTSPGAVGEDALLVAQQGLFQGNLQAESSLDILAAEAYARLRFGTGKHCNLDFIGGYSHFEIDDSLSINSTTINSTTSGGNPVGTIRTFSDRFGGENEFNGGQLGFDMIMHRGCWTVSSLTKVHLG